MSGPGDAHARPLKLPSRHVLLVLDPETAEPDEISEAIRTFGGEGSALTIASEGARPPRPGPDGVAVTVDLALEDVRPEDYDLPVVVGSAPATARLLQHPVVKRAFENLQASQWDRRIKTALLRVSHAAMRAPTDDAFAEDVLRACGEVLPEPTALMVLRRPERNRLRVAATWNLTEDVAEDVRASVEGSDPQSFGVSAMRARRFIHYTKAEGGAIARRLKRQGVREIVAAPFVITEDEPPLGVLVLGTRTGFNSQDRERVELIATECADALHRRQLMHRVEDLARERGLALARLRAAHAELEDFAYSVSHDLSEPLRGICTLASYLRRDVAGKVEREDEEMLAKIEAAGLHLKEMIAGLLAVTRAMKSTTANGGGEGRVDLNELVEGCIVSLTPSLQARNARADAVTDLPVVAGERAAFEQILINLVTNALKHNDKPEPLIKIGCEDAGREWRVFVRDNGPGIPREYEERVFRVYARVPAQAARSGVGIGLALVRKLVERQGGRVWVESEPGAGATFHFTCAKLRDGSDGRSGPDAENALHA